ncbi:carbohydrate ABC transporter permease [Cohnella silvisoli]|uniref:Carbohydrate ABC transporter permease n=1 Tax=Cohnella silvisoli TaxID=2873699 RepID=A0ABV1KL04_9BACL|nr:carbohydrate ABC transporter permease [Cohnella silvisoli]MCD9020855.1 carbohydrate ABC transporter permease [Cohnella silvisoli]
MVYKSPSQRIFSIVNVTFLSLLSIACILPMVHILAVAFSGKAAANANLVNFWPIDFTVDAFRKTFQNRNFVSSMGISVFRTLLGTLIFLVLLMITSYPLSKEQRVFKGRSLYIWYFVITMLFSGGLIPSYILILKLGLNNTIWALVLPGAVDVFSLILMLNFFRNIPKELEEASHIDGASHFTTLFRVYLPLSLPAIATLALFTMVGHWNSWFDGMIYNTKSENYPLATLLQTIIVQQDFSKITMDPKALADISNRTVKAAQIFIGALPILLVYPFLQKYFVKGVILGAVKE